MAELREHLELAIDLEASIEVRVASLGKAALAATRLPSPTSKLGAVGMANLVDPADLALDILEDESLVEFAISHDFGWALPAIASLGGDDAVWRATRGMLAAQLEAAGKSTIALAQLYFDAGRIGEGVAIASEVAPTDLRRFSVWVLVLAQWLEEKGIRPHLIQYLQSRGQVDRILDGFERCDALSGARVEALREWLTADIHVAP